MEIQAALDVADETDSFLQITDVVYDKEADNGYTSLRQSEQTIFLIDQFLKKMENGGFCLFIRHETGVYAQQTLDALERIKAKSTKALLQQVLDFFKVDIKEDEDERSDQLEAVESDHYDDLMALDEQYYDSTENVVALTLKYVANNIKEF